MIVCVAVLEPGAGRESPPRSWSSSAPAVIAVIAGVAAPDSAALIALRFSAA